MAKMTPRGKDAEVYYNPEQVVSIEPARDTGDELVSPPFCIVTMTNNLTFEMDGTVASVELALKVP